MTARVGEGIVKFAKEGGPEGGARKLKSETKSDDARG